MKATQLSSLPNGMLGTTVEVVLKAVHNSGINGLSDHAKVTNLEQAAAAFSDALGKKRKSDLTELLKAAGEALATPYKGLQFAIKGMACSLDADTKALGEKMESRLKDFAKGANLRLPKKKAAYMKALVTEFRKPEYADATSILSSLTDMETVFENYKQLFINRRANVRQLRTIASATTLRHTLAVALKDVMKYVESMAVTTELDSWKTLFTELTDCIRAVSLSSQKTKAPEKPASGDATSAA